MSDIYEYIKARPALWQTATLVINAIIVVVVCLILLRLTRTLFKRIRTKKSNINTQFSEKIVRFLVIFLALMWFIMSNDVTKSFGQTLFQSTTVLAAIAGFAAQSVLADLICGIIITTTKPFDIGDRIELENGIAGIVKDITLRHVVLAGLDTQIYIVPNSKMNSQRVRNMSYHTGIRSVDFRFSVSYTADPEQASQIIRQAIIDSPYSVPGRIYSGNEPEYGRVYFLSFKDSSLEMGTTAYYEPSTPTEVFKNDINVRVKKALEANHIEIPYSYLNVMIGQKDN